MSEQTADFTIRPESAAARIRVDKFKLAKYGAKADYSERHKVDQATLSVTVFKEYPFQPKATLLAAFDALTPHLILLCEQASANDYDTAAEVMEEFPKAERFTVTGIVVKDSGGMLIGRRNLNGKKVLNLTTPFLLWDEQENAEDPYRFPNELKKNLDTAVEEAERYINGDWEQQAAQLDIPFSDQD